MLHQLVNIAFRKAAFEISDAGIIDVINKRMVAILQRDEKEQRAAASVPPMRSKKDAKKSAKSAPKLKPVVEEVDSDDDSAEEPTLVQ